MVTRSKARLSFPQCTLFPTLNCSPSSRRILIMYNHFFYLSPSKENLWNGICDPTARNESRWYSVTIQNATIFDLQVKNIDFRFSSKVGASGIILFDNITFNGKMWCFMTMSGISNCNCCNTVVCETNFLGPISQNGTLYGSQIYLAITFEPVGRFPALSFSLVNAAVVCAILESISGLEASSVITEPMFLKLVTVSNLCPFTLISVLMPLVSFVISLIFSALISMP